MSKSVSVKQANDVDHTNAYTVKVDESDTFTVWTGSDGKGLWKDGQQIEGRGQFSAGRDAAAAIRRYFS